MREAGVQPAADLPTHVTGFTYIYSDGFHYPFGEYFEMDNEEQGTSDLIIGQGNMLTTRLALSGMLWVNG